MPDNGRDDLQLEISELKNKLRELETINQGLLPELAVSKATFKAIFDTSPFGMLLSRDNKFIAVNTALCELLGYTEAELLKLNRVAITHPDDLEADHIAIEKLDSRQIPSFIREKRYITKSGEIIYVHTASSNIVDSNGKLLYSLAIVKNMTDYIRADEALKKSESKFRSLVETTGDWVWESDANAVYTYSSPKVISILGYKASEVIGKTIYDFVPDKYQDIIRKILIEYFRNSLPFSNIEISYLHKNGELVYIESNAEPIFNDNHQFAGYRGIHRNITTRKQAEEKMSALEDRSIKAFRQSPDSITITTLDDGRFIDVNASFTRMTGYTREDVIDKMASELKLWKKPLHRDTIIDLIDKDGAISNLEAEIRIKSGATITILASAELIDIDGKKCLLATSRNITEIKKAELALKQSEQMLSESQKIAHVGSYRRDLITGDIQWSDETFRILGYQPGEAKADLEFLKKHVHKDDLPGFIKDKEFALKNGKNEDMYYRIIRRDGAFRYVHSRSYIEFDNSGNPVRIFGAIQDITEQREAEFALRENEEKYRKLFETSNDGIFLLKDNIFIDCNPQILAMFRCTREHIIGQSPCLFSPAKQSDGRDSKLWETEVINAATKGQPQFFEWNHQRLDGTQFDADVSLTRIEFNNQSFIFAIVRDISERKKAEQTIRTSEATLKSIIKAAPVGIGLTLNRIILSANDRLAEMTGYTLDELIGQNGLMLYPDIEEYEWVGREKYGQIAKYGTGTVETRWKRKDGKIIHILLSSTPIDQNNMGVGIIFTALDITERKENEEKLRQSEQRFRTTFERAPIGIIEGMPRKIIRINQQICDILGYTKDELLAKSYSDLIHPEDFDDIAGLFTNVIAEPENIYSAEKRCIRKDGSVIWTAVTLTGLKQANGELKYIIAAISNITDRKNTEVALENALHQVEQLKSRLQAENIYLQEEIKLNYNFGEIIGNSAGIRKVLQKVEQVAPTSTTVLIMGETGTGKELIARAIHSISKRSSRVLVKVNCAALPPNLIESELFGHERGAFTGAYTRKIGRFELANGGTIFLDEIGDLPMELQVKLLRVLQEGEFERVGSSYTIKVDARVIAATNRNLEEAVRTGKFREDLYYRFNVYPITLPPLRERKDDIPLLVNHFVDKLCKRIGKYIDKIPPSLIETLSMSDWPGNIRGLENLIERSIITSNGTTLELEETFIAKSRVAISTAEESLEQIERQYIIKILETTNWRVSGDNGAAEILRINPNTLVSRMRKLKIKRPTSSF